MIAFNVTCRTREFGIRLPPGASTGRVVQNILDRTAWIVVPAMVVGGALASAVARVVGTFLVGVDPWDPVALVAVFFLLSTVAGIATLLPTLRGTRVEPVAALRVD